MPDFEGPCATTLSPILSQLTLGSSIVTGQATETTCKTGALSAKLVHLRMWQWRIMDERDGGESKSTGKLCSTKSGSLESDGGD